MKETMDLGHNLVCASDAKSPLAYVRNFVETTEVRLQTHFEDARAGNSRTISTLQVSSVTHNVSNGARQQAITTKPNLEGVGNPINNGIDNVGEDCDYEPNEMVHEVACMEYTEESKDSPGSKTTTPLNVTIEMEEHSRVLTLPTAQIQCEREQLPNEPHKFVKRTDALSANSGTISTLHVSSVMHSVGNGARQQAITTKPNLEGVGNPINNGIDNIGEDCDYELHEMVDEVACMEYTEESKDSPGSKTTAPLNVTIEMEEHSRVLQLPTAEIQCEREQLPNEVSQPHKFVNRTVAASTPIKDLQHIHPFDSEPLQKNLYDESHLNYKDGTEVHRSTNKFESPRRSETVNRLKEIVADKDQKLFNELRDKRSAECSADVNRRPIKKARRMLKDAPIDENFNMTSNAGRRTFFSYRPSEKPMTMLLVAASTLIKDLQHIHPFDSEPLQKNLYDKSHLNYEDGTEVYRSTNKFESPRRSETVNRLKEIVADKEQKLFNELRNKRSAECSSDVNRRPIKKARRMLNDAPIDANFNMTSNAGRRTFFSYRPSEKQMTMLQVAASTLIKDLQHIHPFDSEPLRKNLYDESHLNYEDGTEVHRSTNNKFDVPKVITHDLDENFNMTSNAGRRTFFSYRPSEKPMSMLQEGEKCGKSIADEEFSDDDDDSYSKSYTDGAISDDDELIRENCSKSITVIDISDDGEDVSQFIRDIFNTSITEDDLSDYDSEDNGAVGGTITRSKGEISPISFLEKFTSTRRAAQIKIQKNLHDTSSPEMVAHDDFPEAIKLTAEQEALFLNAVTGKPDKVVITKFRLNITSNDIVMLFYTHVVNDNVINFYLKLLEERGDENADLPTVYAMDTFFMKRLSSGEYKYDSVKRWTSKVDIFSKDIILVPVFVDDTHWCMAIIDFKNQTITYYNSEGIVESNVLELLQNFLKDASMDKKKVLFQLENYYIEEIPLNTGQTKARDCGIGICILAECLTRNVNDISFSPELTDFYRCKIIEDILLSKKM